MPEARNVLCDCLQPVFRRDEESAWTIVASAPRSSIHTTESVASDLRADNEIRYPIKHFSFMNDLLTAPVYKRLAINMLSRPRTVQCPEAVLPSNSNWHLSDRASPSAPSRAHSFQDSTTITMRRQTLPSASSAHTGEGRDLSDLIDRAAGKSFSSRAVSDLWGFSAPQSDPKPQRYLPIRAILNREQMTIEERLALDLDLIGATRRGSMYEMAASLDSGADINAAPSPTYETCLHIAVTTYKDERVVLFLLQYNNVNVHARNGNGRTVLHAAVSTGKAETVRRLLELGSSMTEEDENGITPFNIAIDKLTSPRMLLMLLRHARNQGANDEHITNMDPTALHTACQGYPVDVAKALVLLEYGWSPKHRFHTVNGTDPEGISPLYLAVLKKETVLVERMLELEESVFRINAVHGPYPSLLKLTLEDSRSGASMILLLLRAGVDYMSYLPDLYGLARQENHLPLLRWLDNKTRPRIEVGKFGRGPKVGEVISPWPHLPRDTELEHWSEKRKSAIGLAISCETTVFLSTRLAP
jgi:ankyrin repeat protein